MGGNDFWTLEDFIFFKKNSVTYIIKMILYAVFSFEIATESWCQAGIGH